MSLYHKHRPQSLEGVVGNEATVQSLQSCLNREEGPPHSYLFYGPAGCGKTTLGRIVANELGCDGYDYREIDSADFRGIDTIREVRKQTQFRPLQGPCKVWLLDECHKLSNDAQNSLLKALEDTPSHAFFILCTTDPQKLISTVRDRCSQFQVGSLSEKEMMKLLRRVVKAEEDKLNKSIYERIIENSECRPRSALQILDQVLSVDPERREEVANQSAEVQRQSIELCQALINAKGWRTISKILQGLESQDPEAIRRHVLGYCKTVLLNQQNDRAGMIMGEMIDPFYDTGFPGLVYACYTIVNG